MNKLEKMKDYINQNKRNILIGIGVMLMFILTISFVIATSGRDKNKAIDTVETENNLSNEVEDFVGQDNANQKESDWITIEGENKIPEEYDIPFVEVEVAPIDDKEDPQPEGTTGVELDLNLVVTPDHNTNVISYGIDVAKWQGVIDWKQVKASGVDFAMIRVGYRTLVTGIIYEDPYAKYNIQQAQANGIPIGIYFFSTAINEKEAIEEAAWVTSFIAPYRITYPVAYNCEGFNDRNNRQFGMSKNERSKMAIAFLDYVQYKGYTPMFYASKSELERNTEWNTDELSSRYKIWVAQYPNQFDLATSKSSYSGQHHMWQYTSMGRVPGISKPVDLNIAYFGYQQEAEAKDPTPQEIVAADPAALINFKLVNETVTAKVETNLRKVPSSVSSDTIVKVLKNGETVIRTGIGHNGWSRIEYNGQILYAISDFLTTDLTIQEQEPPRQQDRGPFYEKVKEEVTAKEKTNLRSEPSTLNQDTIVAVLYNGEIATRVGIGTNGWSQVEYKGQILYAVTSFLTTDLNAQPSRNTELSQPTTGPIFHEVMEQVTAKIKTNLRLVPNTDSDDTIVVTLLHGDIALRTGVSNSGWSRLEYNGQILYAVSSFLMEVDE